MEQDELFVMQSDTEAEESALVSSVFQDSRISFTRNKVTQNGMTSSELSSSNSYATNMDSSRSGSYVAMSPDPRQHTSIGGISKLKGITKYSSRLLHYKTAPSFDVQNGSNELLDNLNHEESVSTPLSYSDRSNDGLGGYESGEVEKYIKKGYLCNECKHLYKKASRARQAAEQIPKKPDPCHWGSKFWMINRIPSQKKNTRMKKKQSSGLKSIVKKLQSSKPYTKHHVQCLRIHSFLRRNLKLCVETKKLLCMPKGRQKRKRTSSVRKSESKKRKEPVNSSYKANRSKKNTAFVGDSSDEQNSTLMIKRYNVRVMENKMKNVQTCLFSTAVGSSGLQAATQEDDSQSAFRQSLHSDPQEDCNPDESTSSSPFAHVQRGSFRQLLEILNSGYLRSGIINENRV